MFWTNLQNLAIAACIACLIAGAVLVLVHVWCTVTEMYEMLEQLHAKLIGDDHEV